MKQIFLFLLLTAGTPAWALHKLVAFARPHLTRNFSTQPPTRTELLHAMSLHDLNRELTKAEQRMRYLCSISGYPWSKFVLSQLTEKYNQQWEELDIIRWFIYKKQHHEQKKN